MVMKKTCSYPLCPTPVTDTPRCSKHKSSIGQKPKLYFGNNLYKNRGWGRLRSKMLSLHPLCMRCKYYGIIRAALDVDHIRPHKGDIILFNDITNLQTLCHSCHSWKTGKERRDMYYNYSKGLEEVLTPYPVDNSIV